MKSQLKFLIAVIAFLTGASAPAAVRVYIQESNAVAWLHYECTGGEVVRAFALDVSVDKGRILGISDFFRGPSTAAAHGYGIFPGSFRDHISVGPGTNINWEGVGYSPLAVPADNPDDTLPGLNSSGITLEFGGLWPPNLPTAIPGQAGILCSLRISERATVSVAPNLSRGGVVADADLILEPEFSEAIVQPPEITGLSLANGLLTVTFAGGELEASTAVSGPWTGTGDTSGEYTQSVEDDTRRFYRVRTR
jgi:hypothetical protein